MDLYSALRLGPSDVSAQGIFWNILHPLPFFELDNYVSQFCESLSLT